MIVTRAVVAAQFTAYLKGNLPLPDLVDWAEDAMMNAEFDPADADIIRPIVARLGAADVRAFALDWQECQAMLAQLGYVVRLEQ
ncbi:MAG: hypothetical protein KDD83_11850 [Caldilineaceae bacterium]|nr:hypothetical protein [Caldilineaceae bacterium]